MDYTEIVKAIKEFEAMTSQEIQDQVKPIIKSYDIGFLSEHLGVSKAQLYRLCKKLFVERKEKTSFTLYAGIMALGINPDGKKRQRKRGN